MDFEKLAEEMAKKPKYNLVMKKKDYYRVRGPRGHRAYIAPGKPGKYTALLRGARRTYAADDKALGEAENIFAKQKKRRMIGAGVTGAASLGLLGHAVRAKGGKYAPISAGLGGLSALGTAIQAGRARRAHKNEKYMKGVRGVGQRLAKNPKDTEGLKKVTRVGLYLKKNDS